MAASCVTDLLPIFDAYLKSSYTPRFDFLRFGDLCNGSRSFCFSDAFCDVEPIFSTRLMSIVPGGRGRYSINMKKLFNRGFTVLGLLIEEKKAELSSEEQKATECLEKFLLEMNTQTESLLSALEKVKKAGQKETVLSIALAEHLFSKLSRYSYIIDSRVQGKEQNKTCQCGCRSPVNFGATGAGHPKVWHGYLDIIIKDESPVEGVKVVAEPITMNCEDAMESSEAKKSRTDDDECLAMSSISEVKLEIKLKRNRDQAIAQTIVFALALKRLNSQHGYFVPNILICQKHFVVYMYDPVNDILIWSGKHDLWENNSLKVQAILTLWMVIHYELFCSGGDMFENVDEVKANFIGCIRDKEKDFYNQLQIGVPSFETEGADDVLESQAFLDLCEEPKLKKQKTI